MMNFYLKIILFFLSVFTLSQTVSAQTFEIRKDKSYGGSRSDNAMSVMAVENGNYVIAGQNFTIRITTLTGKLIYQNKYHAASARAISLNEKIENGIYNVTVSSCRNVMEQKLIIQP